MTDPRRALLLSGALLAALPTVSILPPASSGPRPAPRSARPPASSGPAPVATGVASTRTRAWASATEPPSRLLLRPALDDRGFAAPLRDGALERRRVELLARVERALSSPVQAVWGQGPEEGLLGLTLERPQRLSASSPAAAALLFLRALGGALGGWAAQEEDGPRAAAPTLRITRVAALDEDTALAAVEPGVQGVPLLHGVWTLELTRGAHGWQAEQVLGRLHGAPCGPFGWAAALPPGPETSPPRPVIAWAGGPAPNAWAGGPAPNAWAGGPAPNAWAGGPAPNAWAGGPAPNAWAGGPAPNAWAEGWRAAWVVRGPGAAGEPREEVLCAATGALLEGRSLVCAGTAQARVVPGDGTLDPRPEDRPLPGLRLFQGLSSAVSGPAGEHPLAGIVEVPALEGPGLRVFRTRWEPVGFAGRRVWDEAGELAWSGPADFTLLDGQLDPGQADAVHAFWHLSSYRRWLGRTFPLTRVWSRRPGEPPALERRIAVWPDVPGPLGTFQDFPHTCAGEEFAGLIQLGVAGPAELGRDERLSLTRVGDLVRHEYTHALLAGLADVYGSGVDEGLADYFPCVEAEDPRWCPGLGPRFFRDLSGQTGRLVYPRDAEPSFEYHRVGNILGQALWEARSAAEAQEPAGRLRVDLAVMAAVVRCPPRPDLLQFRAALVAADRDVNQGRFASAIERACAAHGIGPAAGADAPAPPRALRVTHAASYAETLAPGAWASAFGLDLALRAEVAAAPFPAELAGTRVTLVDARGEAHPAALAAVGTAQVNLLVPPGAAHGPALVRVVNALGSHAEGAVQVAPVAPGVFTADGSGRGLPAGTWVRVAPDGARAEGALTGPVERGPPGSQLFLVLYGSGWAAARQVEAQAAGLPAQVLFAGPQGHPGLDQVNLRLPDLPPGPVELVLRCDGQPANPVQLELR